MGDVLKYCAYFVLVVFFLWVGKGVLRSVRMWRQCRLPGEGYFAHISRFGRFVREREEKERVRRTLQSVLQENPELLEGLERKGLVRKLSDAEVALRGLDRDTP